MVVRRFLIITGNPLLSFLWGSILLRLFHHRTYWYRESWEGCHRIAEGPVPPQVLTLPNLLRMLTKITPFLMKQLLFFSITLVKCFIFTAILNCVKKYWNQAQQTTPSHQYKSSFKIQKYTGIDVLSRQTTYTPTLPFS